MRFLAALFEMMAISMKRRKYGMWERIVEPFHKLGYKSLSPGTTDNYFLQYSFLSHSHAVLRIPRPQEH